MSNPEGEGCNTVSWINIDPACHPEVANDLFRTIARQLDLKAEILPSDTAEDWQRVREMIGMDSVEQVTASLQHPDALRIGTMQATMLVFKATSSEGDLDLFGDRLTELHKRVKHEADRFPFGKL